MKMPPPTNTVRVKYPRNVKIKDADHLLDLFNEYRDDVLSEPFVLAKPFAAPKRTAGYVNAKTEVVRPLTIAGFVIFAGISRNTFNSWDQPNHPNYRPELTDAVNEIRTACEAHNINGAAVGALNPAIIARLHGLTDKQEVETVDKTPKPAPTVDDRHQAIHVHPDDPDPLGDDRPLYSQAQLDAGIPFHDPG